MMDKPDLAELIGAVREFMESVAVPGLKGHAGFHARVAANALAIAEREVRQGSMAAALERQRLISLLGHEGSIGDLNRELCALISECRFTLKTPGLAEHVKLTAMEKIGIDQPAYSGLKHARRSI